MQATDELSFNVLLPSFYWDIYDKLVAEDWDMNDCVRACWQSTLEYDGPAIEGGEYETFRRYLAWGLIMYEDSRLRINNVHANNNLSYKAHLWSRSGQKSTQRGELRFSFNEVGRPL